jgi:hypothetical protein
MLILLFTYIPSECMYAFIDLNINLGRYWGAWLVMGFSLK